MYCPSLCEKPFHGRFLLVYLFFDLKMSMDKNYHSCHTRLKHQLDAHCDFCMPSAAIVFLTFCLKTKTGWHQVDSLTFKYLFHIQPSEYPFRGQEGQSIANCCQLWSGGLVSVSHIRQTTSVMTKAFELFPERVLIYH